MKSIGVSVIAFALMSCQPAGSPADDGTVYTLYRDSASSGTPEDKAMRLHVASFDSSDGADYNRENCDIARGLFQHPTGCQGAVLV